MATSLTDLLADRTKDQEEQILLSVFQTEKLPVSDWSVGAAARTIAKAIASAMLDKYRLAQAIARGQLPELARDMKDAAGNEVRVWLDALATHFYGISRGLATRTIQRCTFSCAAGFGPLNITTGFTARALPSGNRYVYQGAGAVVVPDNSDLLGTSPSLDLTAEEAGARYSDPSGTLVEVITSLPGLSITNPAGAFGGLDISGKARKNVTAAGTGSIALSGTPVLVRSYTATVTASGTLGTSGTLKIEYVANGVVTAVATLTPIPASYAGIGDGITLALTSGAGSGFIVGDVHSWQTPGTPIIQQGVDIETNAQLYDRIQGRWPSLSLNTMADKYVAMIRQASADSAYGISKIAVRPSTTEAGVSNILVATASGAPAAGTLTALQNYVNARSGITERASVVSTTDAPIAIFGYVTVKAAALVATQAAADEAWRKYITGLPIGGDVSTGVPGVVRIAELAQVLMDAGGIDYSGLTIDSLAHNYVLTESQVAVINAGQEPSVALFWNVVA